MIIKNHCPYCKTKVDVRRVVKDENSRTKYFMCGHMERFYFKKPEDFSSVVSSDAKRPMPFQLKGAAFVVNSGIRALIADECGLGKTVQAQEILATTPQALPALIVVKAGLRMQWVRETFRWTGMHGQIILNEKDPNLGFKVYFISMDMLHRIKDMDKFAAKFAFKLIILDECQAIKNHDSKRTNALRSLAVHVPYFLALSGTPIKNHAGEYFPILNLLRPDLFPTLSGYYQDWTDTYHNGYSMKTAGLRNASAFQEYTSEFIIRRTKAEVLPELPRVNRQPLFSELGKEVESAYKKTLREFTDYYDSNEDKGSALQRSANILSFLTKMRHLTGLSKIDSAVAYVEEFLISSSKKIVIFVHHLDVASILNEKLKELCASWRSEYGEDPLLLQSGDPLKKQEVVDKFRHTGSRILIASTLAAGEGVDGLQEVCDTIIILERQWNPANEEQVEGRIERMGQQSQNLTAVYLIATGTVDEFFAEIVERKRVDVANVLDGVEGAKWNESGIMQELASTLASQGGKKWGW